MGTRGEPSGRSKRTTTSSTAAEAKKTPAGKPTASASTKAKPGPSAAPTGGTVTRKAGSPVPPGNTAKPATPPATPAPAAPPPPMQFTCGTGPQQAFAPPANPGTVATGGVRVDERGPTPDAQPGWNRTFGPTTTTATAIPAAKVTETPATPKAASPAAVAKPAEAKPAAAVAEAKPVTPTTPAQPAVPAQPASPTQPAAAAPAAAAVAPAVQVVAPAAPQPPAAPPVAPENPAPPTVAHVEHREPPLLFEIAWEVCWQLGGIYTVLRSKAVSMIDRWGDRYCLIGPYNPSTAAVEFEEQPTHGPIREAMNRLRDIGVPCHFGRWLIAGRPRVLLIDYRARFGNLHVDKYLMWEDHRIELPAHDGEVNEVVAFGFAVAEFFRVLTQVVKDRQILAHFHEWMGGVAVPRIAHLRLPVATVFTTHATLLGRYLAGDNPYFYDHLQFLNPDHEAAKYNIYPRFAIERAAAHASTVFTTVSDVTGVEAEKLLGRTPELIVPNGINLHRFAAPHEFQHLHAKYKDRINDFVKGHFFPSYTFDLDRTLYVFTSGRYEYRNKGMDMFIEAMHRLNWRLKGMQNPPTVVGFIITRAQTRNINVQVLQNQSMYEDLRNTCNEIQANMGNRLLACTARGQLPTFNDLLKEDDQVRLKRAMHAWKSHRQPLIVTHDLADDASDPILTHLRHRHMFNAADDPVKMIFHPEFLTATHPTMSLDYEQFVRGCHMGIFPSYYEPWGYTPLECLALGVPTATSDLAGFGSYMAKAVYPKERREADRQGAFIVQRRGKSFDEACDALVNHLYNFCQLTRRQRIEMRNRTERLAEQFDWGTLAKHYDDAHNMALERVGAPRHGHLEVRVV